jgi:hypothetical protein
MSINISDIQPKPFDIDVDGLVLTCEPPRLSHVLMMSKIGAVFQDPGKATTADIKQAEADMNGIIADLIPALKDKQLSVNATLSIITQLMEQIQPADNKELNDKGVSFGTDPKETTIG